MESNYKRFAVLIAVNTVVMFLLTYTMIAVVDHFYFNINKVYMALMMVSLMNIVMLAFMHKMYTSKKLNIILYSVFALVFILSFSFARTQAFVGDEQFLRSMIPHHSSAILMCEQADITDPEIAELCDQIVKAQQEEIELMKQLLLK